MNGILTEHCPPPLPPHPPTPHTPALEEISRDKLLKEKLLAFLQKQQRLQEQKGQWEKEAKTRGKEWGDHLPFPNWKYFSSFTFKCPYFVKDGKIQIS